jgi:hypothetical protein
MAEPDRATRRLEWAVTAILALAAVATAWSSYQATRWNGEQAKAASRTTGIRIEAARAQGEAEAQTEVDVATFIQWVDAHANEHEDLEDFYEERFRDEFTPAFEAWLATDPFANPDAPPTPFAMDEYQLEARDEAEQLDREGVVSSEVVQRDIRRAGAYVLAVVMFSVALFFGGISTKLGGHRARVTMVALSGAVFLGTLIWVATMPVAFSF